MRNPSSTAHSLLVFVVGGLLAVAGVAFGIEIYKVADTRQPLFNAFSAVCGPHTMGQSFVATQPGLRQIDLWLAWSPPQQSAESTPAATPEAAALMRDTATGKALKYRVFLPIVLHAPGGPGFPGADYALYAEGCPASSPASARKIVISLKREPGSSEVIFSRSLRLDAAEDPALRLRRPYLYQSFTFPPIPDSAGRTFYLSIEAPGTPASAPLLARYHRRDVYRDGTRYVDGAPAPGDLAFRVDYQAGPMSNLQMLLVRLTRQRPIPLSWPWIYPLLLAVYVGCAAWFIFRGDRP